MAHSLTTNLDGITGYDVIVTVIGGRILATPVHVGYFDGAESFGMALAEARSYRGNGQYAITREHYACSCGNAHALDGNGRAIL